MLLFVKWLARRFEIRGGRLPALFRCPGGPRSLGAVLLGGRPQHLTRPVRGGSKFAAGGCRPRFGAPVGREVLVRFPWEGVLTKTDAIWSILLAGASVLSRKDAFFSHLRTACAVLTADATWSILLAQAAVF